MGLTQRFILSVQNQSFLTLKVTFAVLVFCAFLLIVCAFCAFLVTYFPLRNKRVNGYFDLLLYHLLFYWHRNALQRNYHAWLL